MLRKTSRALLTAFLAIALIGCGSAEDPDGDDTNHVNVDPGNDEPGNDDPGNDDPGNDDPGNDDPGNDEPGNNDDPSPAVEPPGELLMGSQSREDSPDVEEQGFAEFSADNRDFAFSMLGSLHEEEGDDENLFLSPHSISLALAMTYAGAKEETKAQMAEALHFLLDDDELHPAFNKLDQELATRADFEPQDSDDVAFDLDIVNQTWGHNTFPFLDDYLELLAMHYGAGMYSVNFASDYEEIRQGINKWVEAQTNERIEDLLPEESLTEYTRFVLVNAIYFFGSWRTTFSDNLTTDADFTRIDDSTTSVPLMRHSEPINTGYYEEDGTVAITLPYVGGDVSMVAMMPADEDADFLQWEADFGRQQFDAAVDGLTPMTGSIRFPKFEDEGDFDLKTPFEALGMEDAFESTLADFTGMYDDSQGDNLYITAIFHKSFVSVDEEGTEAAAATAVVMGDDSAPMMEFDVTFDRPFYYAIYDHPTDTILFLGRMVDPS